MSDKLTKCELARKLGISRPTLDKYLREGFPQKFTEPNGIDVDVDDKEYQKLLLENEIRLLEYTLKKLKSALVEMKGE